MYRYNGNGHGTVHWRKFDYVLFATVVLLIIYGVLMIRSATLGAVDTDLIERVERQIQYGIVGVLLVVMLTALDYRTLGALHQWIYLAVLALLGMVTFFGLIGEAGAQRWLNVGIAIQPSEISKVLLIIALGQHLANQYEKFNELKTVLVSLIYIAIPALFVFLQPSLGVTIVIMTIWAVMVWAAGLRLRHIGLFVLALIVLLPVVWIGMEDYQRDRIFTFFEDTSDVNVEELTPEEYQEIRDRQYNIEQALISVGSGGLLGQGYAQGTQTQLRFQRVRHTDFIFTVIAHELGFVGAVAALGLIGVVIWRITRVARLASDAFGSLICYGVATLIFFQTFVAVGMNLNVLPVTGLPIPFIASGGSSLLTMLFGIGLVESVAVRRA
ncbi:MAG: rod shape-determining protein RodA [Anaerolineae bacterium]|nr:rod shape-determining protein RodA [Anaerolineae bacterium]